MTAKLEQACQHRRQPAPPQIVELDGVLPCAACDQASLLSLIADSVVFGYQRRRDVKGRWFWHRMTPAPSVLEQTVTELAHLYLDDHRREKTKPTLMDLADLVDLCDPAALETAEAEAVAAAADKTPAVQVAS